MTSNPVISALGRRLRLGVIGGGPGSFIGEVHRTAARLDDYYEVVAAVLSSDPARSRQAGQALGIARSYANIDELLQSESTRADGIDVIAIMTPNDSHYPLCCACLEQGLDIICDKPLTTSLADALDLVQRVRKSGRVFCLTHNYSGYPLARQARAMVQAGLLGEIRMVHVTYVQGHNAAVVETDPPAGLRWRMQPDKAGASLILGDIGSHAHHLACFVSGLQLTQICADVGAVIPQRQFDDYAGALLRFDNGARGVMWVTQAAAGAEHGLSVRVQGTKGGLEWQQEEPNHLKYMPLGQPVQVFSRGGPGLLPAAERATRVAIGHPEGFYEAFANLYADVAEAIIAQRSGRPADPLALDFPTVEDGARGMKFIEAALESSRSGGQWVDCTVTF